MMRLVGHSRLALVGVILLVGLSTAVAGPQVGFPETIYDFGHTPRASKVSHTFWLKSVGDDTLEVRSVRPGCGCTKVPFEDSLIAPGDSTRLEIIFTTLNFISHTTKEVRITVNDGLPDWRLAIKANIHKITDTVPPLIIDPPAIEMSADGRTARTRKPFALTNTSSDTLRLSLIDSVPDWFEVKLPENLAPGEIAGGVITLMPGHAETEFARSFTLEATSLRPERYTIPVKLTFWAAGQP